MARTKRKAGARATAEARPERPETRARRRRFFKAWVGITFVMAVAVAVLAPVLEAEGNVQRWVAVFAAGMAVLLFLAVGWLVFYVHRRRRP